MKAALEHWLHRRWYGEVAPGLGLRALAGLYRVLSTRDTTVAERLPVPVIVVGNFTAGGTGKTPLVIALARYFAARGLQPGIVSRGHGRRSSAPVRVAMDTPVADCGDEPRLMFERTGVPVLVDSDRVAAARAAIAAGCGLVIADDGLQHRRLGRDVEIEVVDALRGYGNGLLIPAGPLRERPRPVDFTVVNGDASTLQAPAAWPMRLELGDAIPLDPRDARRALREFAGSPVHAVAGIGNPERFFEALREAGLSSVPHAFGDHHAYGRLDFEPIGRPILMTEKDAVKCRALGIERAWAVPVEARLDAAFFAAVEHRLGTE